VMMIGDRRKDGRGKRWRREKMAEGKDGGEKRWQREKAMFSKDKLLDFSSFCFIECLSCLLISILFVYYF